MFQFRFSCIFALINVIVAQQKPEKVIYHWNYANFTWPSVEAYQTALKNNDYIIKNNAITGIRLWKDRLYLTVPRFKDGVPATLLVTSATRNDGNKSPLLEPFPNWEWQRVGNCSAFQFVQNIEIDPLGRMLVIDSGRVATLTDNPKNYCPPRLVVLDLENNNKVLLNYILPEEVARRKTVYLSDAVVEPENGGYAYITDADDEFPGIIVFSVIKQKAWKVTHESMKATSVKFTVKYDGTKVSTPLNVNGIALSSASQWNKRILYYSPLSSREIFAVPTNILRNEPSNIGKYVRSLGKKPSQADGMINSAHGQLYFGQLANNSVSCWDTKRPPFQIQQRSVFADNRELQWPDRFAIDEKGVLWTVSNRFQRFLKNKVDLSQINYRVLKLANIGSKSYNYYENGTAPPFPHIG